MKSFLTLIKLQNSRTLKTLSQEPSWQCVLKERSQKDPLPSGSPGPGRGKASTLKRLVMVLEAWQGLSSPGINPVSLSLTCFPKLTGPHTPFS